MGTCMFCGQPAGLLRTSHKTCRELNTTGVSEVQSAIAQYFAGTKPIDELQSEIRDVASAGFISSSQEREILRKGWEGAVNSILDDSALTELEEARLTELKDRLELPQEDVDRSGALTRIVKAAILRDLSIGKIPKRVRINGQLPFNFQRGEELVWLFNDVRYLEDKTRTQYVGGSHGLSFRIAKGVYYRVSAFKGHPISTTERTHVDTGQLAITTKHFYFGGSNKSFRVRLDKIVTFQPYEDGIGIVRDAASAKPQTFVTGDGWFTYNLAANLSTAMNQVN